MIPEDRFNIVSLEILGLDVVINIRIHCGRSLSKGARLNASHESESPAVSTSMGTDGWKVTLGLVSGLCAVGFEVETNGGIDVDLTDVIVDVVLIGRPGPLFDGVWTEGEGECVGGDCGEGEIKGEGDFERTGGEGSGGMAWDCVADRVRTAKDDTVGIAML